MKPLNKREKRVVECLLSAPLTRESVDFIGDCSNGPALISDLRARGLDIPCTWVERLDKDGIARKAGQYHITKEDRPKLINALEVSK